MFGLFPVLVGVSPFLTLQVWVGKYRPLSYLTVFVLQICRNGETDTELEEREERGKSNMPDSFGLKPGVELVKSYGKKGC